MAASIYDWSLTAASNSNADSDVAWPEGQAPSTVNNSARAMMQRVKELLVDLGGSLAASGTANGLLVTAESAFSAYADGQVVAFRATASNTGAATLSVNGIGAKSIRKFDASGEVALTAGDIRNTGIYVVRYSAALNAAAGAWLMVNPTYSGKAPTQQIVTATGTVTFTLGTRFVQFEGVAGGGAGGGVNGTSGSNIAGAGGGGGPGRYGWTPLIDVTAIATAAVTIGAAGVPVNGAGGGSGGNTVVVCGATTYTWNGGTGGTQGPLTASANQIILGGAENGSTNLQTGGSSSSGGLGLSNGIDTTAVSGAGGSTPFGTGGFTAIRTSSGVTDGINGGNYGSGGSGGVGCDSASNAAGGAGAPGLIRVWEYS